MGLSVTKHGTVHVLRLTGGLKSGKAADDVGRAIEELANSGYSRFVFNMTDVSVIDSTGIGILMRAHSAALNRNGAIKLVNLSDTLTHALSSIRVLPLFDLSTSEEQAVQELQSKAVGHGS